MVGEYVHKIAVGWDFLDSDLGRWLLGLEAIVGLIQEGVLCQE